MIITTQITGNLLTFAQDDRLIMAIDSHGFKLHYHDVVPKLTEALQHLQHLQHLSTSVTLKECEHTVCYFAGHTCILTFDKFVFNSHAARLVLRDILNATTENSSKFH